MPDDACIKLGAEVSDIHGVSARAMVRGLIEDESEAVLLSHARGALKRETGRTRHGNNTIRMILRECTNAARMTKSTPISKYRILMVW